MTNSQVTLTHKQLSIFIWILITAIVVLVVFFVVSSGRDQLPGPAVKGTSVPQAENKNNDGFLGEKGITVVAADGKVYIDESEVDSGNMHSFNYYSEKEGKNIYFFI
ncbi:hypothetical protein KKD61_00225 [Patescibacteria group bacterium]|nr:hypothetical protein [Patescibacteria group bacterium]